MSIESQRRAPPEMRRWWSVWYCPIPFAVRRAEASQRLFASIALHAIVCYSSPGDLVLDPNCGPGATVVQAMTMGRHGLGISSCARAVDAARRHVAAAADAGATGGAAIVDVDPRTETPLHADRGVRGRVALLVTDAGRLVRCHLDQVRLPQYEPCARAQLLGEVLAGCGPLLASDAVVVLVARSWWRHGQAVDYPMMVAEAAAGAGLMLVQRCVAVPVGAAGMSTVPRWLLHQWRRLHHRGVPVHLPVHRDILILQRPRDPTTVAESTRGCRPVPVRPRPDTGGWR